jgi:hypothetical protein
MSTSPASATRARLLTVSTSIAGPAPQLAPNATSGGVIAWRNSTARSGVSPIMVRPPVSKVIVDATGSPVAAAAAIAAPSSSRPKLVSIHNTSTPPSTRPSACSPKVASASSRLRVPWGTSISPVGPIDPATTTGRSTASAAARARRAPARLISRVRASAPSSFKRQRLDPNVFVRMMSAPTSMKLSWRRVTFCGASRFHRSGACPAGRPIAIMLVPVAPSASR